MHVYTHAVHLCFQLQPGELVVFVPPWPYQERGSQLARKAKRLAQVLLAQRLLLGGTRLR